MDELVKLLRNRRICIQQSGSLEDFPLLREAADAIEKMTEDNNALNGTITNLLEQIKDLGKPRWIPVTERLPEERKDVLVALRRGEIAVDYYQPNRWGYSDVTHWQPLPEPPEEE